MLTLTAPIYNTNRNVTGDNQYSSYELVSEIKRLGLTHVDTVRKNKEELLQKFVSTKVRPKDDSMFGFQSNRIIISYIPQKN